MDGKMETGYGEDYYQNYDMGDHAVSYLESTQLRKFHAEAAREIAARFHPGTTLDAGCAMGVLVSELRKLGVDAYGLDFSDYAVKHADPIARDHCFRGSLAEPFPRELPRKFDLVTCMEVLEHMTPEDGRKAISNLCKVTDTVLFCSTPDDFEDRTHINVQQREYWAALFAENGFYDDLGCRPQFMTDYAVCYRRMTDRKQPIEIYERYVRATDAALRDFRDSHYQALEREHEKAVSEWTRTARDLQTVNAACSELRSALDGKEQELLNTVRQYNELLSGQAEAYEKTTASWKLVAEELSEANRRNQSLQEACEKRDGLIREGQTQLARLQQDRDAKIGELTRQCEQLQQREAQSALELQKMDELEQELGDTASQLQNLNGAYGALKAEYEKAMKVYNDTYHCLNQVSFALEELKASTSWRVTAPMRWTVLHLKHLIGRSARLAYHILKGIRQGISGEKAVNSQKNWPPRVEPLSGDQRPAAVSANCRRLAVYTIYDPDGVVDDYVLYYLKALKPLTEKIIVVSNGPLRGDGTEKLRDLGCQVVIRENEGFDAWGVKCGLETVGYEALSQYDEVVISNNTLFGPVSDLKILFRKMAGKKVDFWGITAHPGWEDQDPFGCNPYGFIPEHVQSFFYVVRKRMVTGKAFRKFWENLPELPGYQQAVGLYETVMTRYFADAGYRWATYLNGKDYYDMTDNPLIAMPVESMRDLNCPFFKRRAFFQDYDYLSAYTGFQSASTLLQYLKEETEYPVSLVWQNLIRTCHMSDLCRNLHLARIFDRDDYFMPAAPSSLKAALFMHIYDETMAAELKHYASSLPETADIYISTVSEEKKAAILKAFSDLPNQVEIRVLPNRGRDVSALLTSFRDVVMNYDVACVTHDKKTGYLKPQTVGEGFAYMGYENILAGRSFTRQVLSAFEADPFLGLLYAPDPNHADFATHIGLEWGENFEATRRLAEELNLHVPMDEKHPPMAPFGSSFWFRTAAMQPLFAKDWTYEDFPEEPFDLKDGSILHAIERIYPYAAQEAGFYSAMLATADYAAVDLGNLSYYAQQYTEACFENGIANRFITVRDLCRMKLDPAPASAPAEEEQKGGKLRRILTQWVDCQ